MLIIIYTLKTTKDIIIYALCLSYFGSVNYSDIQSIRTHIPDGEYLFYFNRRINQYIRHL